MNRVLAISGSLRQRSLNTALIRSAVHLTPQGMEIAIYEGIGNLPLFNPDLEGVEPSVVLDFRAQLKRSSGVLISSPEYAHGITGVLKNALDWVVKSGEFVGKPVCLINTSSRSTIAYESLKEILKTMDAKIVSDASIVIGLPHSITKEEILEDANIREQLSWALTAFGKVIL